MKYRTYARVMRVLTFATAVWIAAFSVAWWAFGLRHVATSRFGASDATILQMIATLGPLALEWPFLTILTRWGKKELGGSRPPNKAR